MADQKTEQHDYERIAEMNTKNELSEKNDYMFRTLFEQASDGIFIADKDGNYLDVNTSGCEMLGYSKDELLKLNLKDIILKEDVVNSPFKFDERSSGNVVLIQCLLVRKDGSIIPVEISGKQLSDGITQGIVRNISERKQFETELIEAKMKAEESDRLKTAFLQNMSHEIRTPMNAIIGFSDLLPEYLDDHEKLISYSNTIKQRSLDLLEVISSVLEIAKIEARQLPVNPEECKMYVLFDSIEKHFKEYTKKSAYSNIEFSLKVARSVKAMEVFIDQIKLKQILMNLIGNAFKFTNNGRIEVGCYLNEPNVFTFFVADTGIGISKEKHAEIFSRFIQANDDNPSRIYGGTGLGLSIVHGLLKLIDGKIWLESEQGKGSTFYFTLPFKPTGQRILEFSDSEEVQIAYNQPNLNILIVDDDEFNTEYLIEILSDTNCTLTQTRFGMKAVEICKNQNIDLVLIDIRLPDINGFEVVRKIKAENQQIKIIAQTAYSTPDDKQRALQIGCVDYLSKPIRSEALKSRIENLFRKVNS